MSDTEYIKDNNVLTVKPVGRLDTITSPVLEKEIQQYISDVNEIIIDFERLEYISSSGMRVLLATEQEMEDRLGSFRVINVNDKVYDIFETVGFLDMVQVN